MVCVESTLFSFNVVIKNMEINFDVLIKKNIFWNLKYQKLFFMG